MIGGDLFMGLMLGWLAVGVLAMGIALLVIAVQIGVGDA